MHGLLSSAADTDLHRNTTVNRIYINKYYHLDVNESKNILPLNFNSCYSSVHQLILFVIYFFMYHVKNS